uniref:C-type lectin domain-containing protein n=1 Tax=Panagrolaimus davidi TaxID=227884 RepID=A0A914PK57_9BILA
MLFLFLLLIFIVPIKACPNQSIPSYRNSSICYYLINTKTDFIDAEGICIGFGGHLTSVHDMFENLFLSEKAHTNFTSDNFWFGANNLEGNWSWMDNIPFDFSDWGKGEPQNISNCGAVRIQDGKWITDDCFNAKPFICKAFVPPVLSTTTTKTTSTKPKICPPSWTFYKYTGFCYKVFDNATWQDAEKRCNIDKANLASIHCFEESEFVADLAYWPGADVHDGLTQAWIGLYTEDNNTHWQWTDGTPFDYSKWSPGNPDYPGIENCVIIILESYMSNWKAGEFNNQACINYISKYVCKKSPQ